MFRLRRGAAIALAAVCAMPLALAANAPAPVAIPAQPTVTAPTGAYQTAWLDLTGGDHPVRVFLALRDGKPVQFWSLNRQLPGSAQPAGSPRLLTDSLSGATEGNAISAEIHLRLVSIWAPMKDLDHMTLTLKLNKEGDKVTGTWTNAATAGTTNGQVAGMLQDETTAHKTNGLAAGQDWPAFYGTGAALRGPDYGKAMVEDLAQAKPLWRSETVSLSGWGTGVDGRYMTRAAYGTLCGGASSPVVADGRVYLYHYRPSGDVEPVGKDAELLAQFKENPVEYDAVRRFFSTRADVVVSCIDAATGQTLWESVWPQKQGNYQTHKWRAFNPTPSVAGGVVVVGDYSWGLHAYDARTGELKWTRGGGGAVPRDSGAIGPVIAGDTVIWPTGGTTYGLDLNTGAERWKAPGAGSARRMVIDGKERILLVGQTLILVDPANGAEIARTAFPGGVDSKGRFVIGRGAGANLVCDGPYIVSFKTSVEDGRGSIFALKVVDNKIEPAWTNEVSQPMEDGHVALTIANGRVFTAFQAGGGYAIELATGKTIKNLPDFTANSNPIFVTVDNRIFWQPECQHGSQFIQLIDADTFTPMGTRWAPPHNDTTAYGEMPIANVVVDGRLIVRGIDGLYCYDLRK